MNHLPYACLPLLAALLPQAALAQSAVRKPPTLQAAIGNPDDFKLSGSLRVRYETLDGQPRTGFNASDEQLAIRTTLFGEYSAGPVRIGGEVYDSRVTLKKTGSAFSANEANALELVQAYVATDISQPFGIGSKATVQLGRMMLNLGSRRLVAADEYRNTTNGYTGLRADLKLRDGTTATLIYTLPQLRLPDDLPSVRRHRVRWDRESFDLRLWGGLIARPATLAGAMAELGYFRLQERDWARHPTRDRDLHTVSARLIREPKAGRIDFEAEGMTQFGRISASAAPAAGWLDVSAYFLHADAGYTFPGTAKLRVSVEYDHASGDGPGRSYGRFDTLFGMRRADLAPAGIYSALARSNIDTPGLRIEAAPSPRWDAMGTYHALWLADRHDAFASTGVRDASGKSGRFAGHQIDARLRYWLIPQALRAEINAVWLVKGRFLHDAPSAPATGDTHYLATGLMASF